MRFYPGSLPGCLPGTRTTVQQRVLTGDLLEEWLIRPCRELGRSLGTNEGYIAHLAELAGRPGRPQERFRRDPRRLDDGECPRRRRHGPGRDRLGDCEGVRAPAGRLLTMPPSTRSLPGRLSGSPGRVSRLLCAGRPASGIGGGPTGKVRRRARAYRGPSGPQFPRVLVGLCVGGATRDGQVSPR